ncbi:urease accessory protein UreF [Kineococcus aurantiacus]|uniref:Urease accessory protein n=1 Tax=Kineococcus aurantiacus TaxID=37633 RepID=A0A7Y9DN42_9ACTN|nr:urease accessory UreF family protein [Kineococcus aurantiacus]NYD23666.1 urease accessory protein [Kineococcus aurantiacus]
MTGPGPTPDPAPDPDLLLALLADARLPVGAHTQSAGLEPAVAHGGLALADVPEFLHGRLRTVVAVEAGTAVVARHHVLAGLPPGPVEDAWAARTPSPPLRAASRTLGRGYLRMAGRVWPHPVWAALGRTPPRPLVLGALAAVAGLDAARLVRLCVHDDAATVGAAALKLLPTDPVDTVAWTVAAHRAGEGLVADLAHLTDPDDVPAPGAPLTEEFSLLHTTTPMRLFHA